MSAWTTVNREADMTNLIFVVGVGRSGTSLLQSMLAANSHFCVLPETAALRRLVYSGRLAAVYRRGGRDAIDSLMRSDERLEFLSVDLDTCIDAAIAGGHFDAIRWYQSLLDSFRGDTEKCLVDKDPKLVEYLPAIGRDFEGCHVIHVVRDPRDVLLSRKRAAWSRHRPWWHHVLVMRTQFAVGISDGQRSLGQRYHQVVYEQLIGKPEEMLRQLCGQLGVAFEPTMLTFEQAAASLVRPDELSWKSKTLSAIDSDNTRKWKSDLAPFETAVCELVCHPTIEFGNYESSYSVTSLPSLKRLAARAMAAMIKLGDLVLRCVLRWRLRRRCRHATA